MTINYRQTIINDYLKALKRNEKWAREQKERIVPSVFSWLFVIR